MLCLYLHAEAEAVESHDSEPTDDIGVDALITILQDPDTGVPRPSVAALKDVKLRTGRKDSVRMSIMVMLNISMSIKGNFLCIN